MRRAAILLFALVFPACGSDLSGTLAFLDGGPQSTPVEAVNVTLVSLADNRGVAARPEPDGKFLLPGIGAGHYRLLLPIPARIVSFQVGAQERNPLDFEPAGQPVRIVLSLAVSDVVVEITGIPAGVSPTAILAPRDPALTLQESCYAQTVSGGGTTFRYVPPGRYRVLVSDTQFQADIAKFAPRLPGFLETRAAFVDARADSGERVQTAYIPGSVVRAAVAEATREANARKR